MKSAAAFACDYRPSRRLALVAALVAVVAALVVLGSGLAPGWRIAIVTVICVYAVGSLRSFLAPPFVRIAHGESGWQLLARDGRTQPATLRRHVRLGPLLALDFVPSGPPRRFHCVLSADVIDAQTRRRLLLVLARPEDATAA